MVEGGFFRRLDPDLLDPGPTEVLMTEVWLVLDSGLSKGPASGRSGSEAGTTSY